MNREIRIVCDQETLEKLIGLIKPKATYALTQGRFVNTSSLADIRSQLESELQRQFVNHKHLE